MQQKFDFIKRLTVLICWFGVLSANADVITVWPFNTQTPVYYITNIYTVDTEQLTNTTALQYPQWNDYPVQYAYSATGPSAPALTATTTNTSISALAFDNSDILYGIMQFPHNIAKTNASFENFYFEPHMHFDVAKYIDNTHTNVTWKLEWQLASLNGSFGATQGTNTVTSGITVGDKHYVVSLGSITNNAVGISAIFRCKITRPASTGQDYSNAHDVFFDGLDIHVPIGNTTILGSRQIYSQ